MLVEGGYGTTPAPIDESVSRAVGLLTGVEATWTRIRRARRTCARQPTASQRARRSSSCSPCSGRGGDAAPVDPRSAIRANHRCCRETSTRRAGSGSASSSRSCRSRAWGRSRSRTRGCASPSAEPTSPVAAAAPLATSTQSEPPTLAVRRLDAGRVAHGRRLLSLVEARGPPFVEVGDVVTVGQTLCLLEAMKLFNELKAESEGRVHRDPRGERPAGRVRPAVVRARVGRRTTGRLTMFSRVLVANRGEVAVRVIRALHELGVEAVAVYSTADKDALHVRMADEAVCIGPPPATDSYLRIPNIDRGRRTTGARRSIRASAFSPRTRRSSAPATRAISSSSGRRPR